MLGAAAGAGGQNHQIEYKHTGKVAQTLASMAPRMLKLSDIFDCWLDGVVERRQESSDRSD